MRRGKRGKRLPWALACCLLAGAPAAAQDESLSTIAVDDAAATGAPPRAGEADAPLIETVVVTGELLQREASRTTTSVAVTSGAEIERSTARDVYDVIRATPNASLHDNAVGYGSITLRGIGSYGAATSVQNIALYSAATAIVFDGVALPRSAMAYSDLSAFDLNQVEIFRGPQSTSQGRNAMAGAVIINTTEPQVSDHFDPEFRGRLAGGSDATYQGAAAFGATLWPDVLAVRVVTDHRATDGDIDNITRDRKNWARDDSHGTRLRAKLTPFGADGPYSVLLAAGDIRRLTGSRYLEQAYESERVATSDEPSFIDTNSQLYSADQRLSLGEVWQLRAVSGYARSKTHMHIDTDYSADDGGYLDQQQKATAFSQELRASFDAGDWRGSFGAYYFKGRDGDVYDASTAVKAFANAFGLCAVQLACELPLGNVLTSGEAPAKIEDIAVFGEVDWRVFERLTLTAGLRLDHERNSRVIVSDISGDSLIASSVVSGLQASGALGENGSTAVGRSFSALLPKIAASYELFSDAFIGAAYSEGYRPGGDSYNYASGRRYRFDAERTQNYELSFKGVYQPWRLQYALNLFHTDWTDMQVTVGTSPDTYIDNAGRSRIDGGEAEVAYAPADWLRVIGGFGITHGRFEDFVTTDARGAAADYGGNPLPTAPETSASLALEWSPWRTLTIRPDVQMTGHASAQPDDAATHQLPKYTLLNLSVNWRIGHFGVFFNGSNLTDRQYRTDAATYSVAGNQVAALGYGRRLIGGLDFEF